MRAVILFCLVVFMSAAYAQERSPVQGDDLIQLLGKRRTAEIVSRLNKFIGNKDSKEDISFLNYGKGIQLNIEHSVVVSVDLYNDKNYYSEEFKAFPGDLPMGLSFKSTIFQVKQKLGDGFSTDGEVTSVYEITKTFHLNNDDDYLMTVEFVSGRMMVLSMRYIENGGTEEENTDNTNVTNKFTGNDFFIMIKKNRYNLEFSRFIGLLGKLTYYDKHQRLYLDDGVDVNFNDRGAISSITLYSGGQHSNYKDGVFGAYQLDLPFGLRMENSRSSVITKVGPPLSDSGNVISYKEGFVDFQIAFSGDKINYLKFELAEK